MTNTTCQLSLLGEFRLTRDERPVTLHDSAARLLAFLALHGRTHPVGRATLVERLWCDASPAKAQARLRSVLWRMPRVDERPVVTASNAHVALADFVEVDYWRADSRANEIVHAGNADAAESTESTATAADLQGLDTDLLPSWSDDWLILERESFRQARLHALERESERLWRAGCFSQALRAALAAVSCEPLRETAHRRVIEVHLAEGNPAEAIRQYQSFRRLLARELGLPPGQAIRTLVAPLLGRPLERTTPQRSTS